MTTKPKGRSLLGAAGVSLRRTIDATPTEIVTITPAEVPPSEAKAPNATDSDVPTVVATNPEENHQPGTRPHRNASPAIRAGKVTMRTVYLTNGDRDRFDDAVLALKKTRRVPGQIGFSLVVRIAARLLEEQLDRDPNAVLELARELTGRRFDVPGDRGSARESAGNHG